MWNNPNQHPYQGYSGPNQFGYGHANQQPQTRQPRQPGFNQPQQFPHQGFHQNNQHAAYNPGHGYPYQQPNQGYQEFGAPNPYAQQNPGYFPNSQQQGGFGYPNQQSLGQNPHGQPPNMPPPSQGSNPFFNQKLMQNQQGDYPQMNQPVKIPGYSPLPQMHVPVQTFNFNTLQQGGAFIPMGFKPQVDINNAPEFKLTEDQIQKKDDLTKNIAKKYKNTFNAPAKNHIKKIENNLSVKKKDTDDIHQTTIDAHQDIHKKEDREYDGNDNRIDDDDIPDIKGDREWVDDYSKSIAIHKPNNGIGGSISYLNKSSSRYEQIKARCSPAKPYIDPEFPTRYESLWGYGSASLSERYLKSLAWGRPTEIFKGEPYVVFNEGIDINDVIQGGLGDCYLLASIASIAEHPDRLKRLYLTRKPNKEGIYALSICIDGIFEEVILDDQFPIQPLSKTAAFNSTKTNEIWVMLLEKAYAKVYGAYANINAGLTREALRDLTGAPCQTYFVKKLSPDQHWAIIRDADEKDHIMAAQSGEIAGKKNDAQDEETGLSGNHAYSLIDAYEIIEKRPGLYDLKEEGENNNLPVHKVLKIRNPWGKGEWKHEWSDSDPRITKELRKKLDMEKEDDGVFLLPLEEFLKYFASYQLCHYNDDFMYSAQKYQSDYKNPSVLEFEIKENGIYYFSVVQVSKRHFNPDKKYKYTPITMIVAQIVPGSKPKFIGMVTKADKELWFKANCDSGNYVAWIHTPWVSFINQFTFSTYGPTKIDFRMTGPSRVPRDFLDIMLLNERENGDGMTYYGSRGHPEIGYCCVRNICNLDYFYFRNDSKDTILAATVRIPENETCEPRPPYAGKRPQVTIGPGERKIIMFEKNGKKAVRYGLLTSFKSGGINLVKKAKECGTLFHRTLNQQQVKINVFILEHPEGIIYYYENNSNQYCLREHCRFSLSGCQIEGVIGNGADINLKPGETHLLHIVKLKTSDRFEAQLEDCRYDIVEI